jgi:hypothetical protein
VLRVLGFAVAAVILAAEARAIGLRYFVNDDYQMLYSTWLVSTGKIPLVDFNVQSFHILPALLSPVLRIAGFKIESAFVIRGLFWAGLVLLPVLAVALARYIVPARWAPYAAIASLASWPMLERGLDIRPDLLLALLWLYLLARESSDERSPGRAFTTGALLAVAVVLRVKAALIAPALLFLALRPLDGGPVVRRESLTRLAAALGGAALVVTSVLLYLGATHQLDYLWVGSRILGGIAGQGLGGWETRRAALVRLWVHDWHWVLLLGLGIADFLRGGRSSRATGWAVLGTAALLVVGDPAFYSYNFVVLLPLLSGFVAAGCGSILERIPTPTLRSGVAAGLALVFPLSHLHALWALATQQTNERQLALAHLLDATRPETTVFAMEGLGLFRPSLYDWRMSEVSAGLYRAGLIRFGEELRTARPEVIVLSYRVPGWLDPADQQLLKANYVADEAGLGLLGTEVSNAEPRGELWVRRAQPFVAEVGPCLVDGVVHAPGDEFELAPGAHTVAATEQRCRVHFALHGMEQLRSSRIPYLISPDFDLYEGTEG